MLKAVIVDAKAVSRDLLNTVLTEGKYEVVGQTHTGAQGYALVQKYHPHILCVALDQMEDGSGIVESTREHFPKTLIFLMSGEIDARTVQDAHARGVNGFIVKPFKADAVLKTIRNAVLAMIKQQQA
jgi:two-component system, chemotaxis family, chemotaxis protein CheY